VDFIQADTLVIGLFIYSILSVATGLWSIDGQLSFYGTRRVPRTWPADQVTAPPSVKFGARRSN